jgi:hypothetical protein
MGVESIEDLVIAELRRRDERADVWAFAETPGAHAWFSEGNGSVELLVPDEDRRLEALQVAVGDGDAVRAPRLERLEIGGPRFARFVLRDALAWPVTKDGRRPELALHTVPDGLDWRDDYLVLRDLAIRGGVELRPDPAPGKQFRVVTETERDAIEHWLRRKVFRVVHVDVIREALAAQTEQAAAAERLRRELGPWLEEGRRQAAEEYPRLRRTLDAYRTSTERDRATIRDVAESVRRQSSDPALVAQVDHLTAIVEDPRARSHEARLVEAEARGDLVDAVEAIRFLITWYQLRAGEDQKRLRALLELGQRVQG